MQDVKKESQLYFDKMDNTFLGDLAGKIAGSERWKAISSVIKLEKSAAMQYVLDQNKQQSGNNTPPPEPKANKRSSFLHHHKRSSFLYHHKRVLKEGEDHITSMSQQVASMDGGHVKNIKSNLKNLTQLKRDFDSLSHIYNDSKRWWDKALNRQTTKERVKRIRPFRTQRKEQEE